MAKEKFVRSKPHVNIGGWFKEKLGLGSVAPPAEPVGSDVDEAVALNPLAAEPIGQSFDPEEALGAGAIEDTVGDGLGEIEDGWEPDAPSPLPNPDVGEAADEGTSEGAGSVMPPRMKWEMAVGHGDDDAQGPTQGRGANEMVLDDTPGGEPEASTPEPRGAVGGNETITVGGGHTENAPEDEVLVSFEHGDANQPYVVGGLWNGKGPPPEGAGLNAEDGSTPPTEHEHVYQHNQTDLDFQTARASSEPALDAGLADEGEAAAAQKLWQAQNFRMEMGGLPAPDGDPDQPVIVGSAPNAADDSSTIADLKVSEHLVPLDTDGPDDADGFEDVVRELPDLDD